MSGAVNLQWHWKYLNYAEKNALKNAGMCFVRSKFIMNMQKHAQYKSKMYLTKSMDTKKLISMYEYILPCKNIKFQLWVLILIPK